MPAVAALLLLLAAGGAEFQAPSAEWAEVDSATLAVTLVVGLSGSDGPVAVHLVLPGEAGRVIPMTARGGGIWEAAVEIRKADWRVVFEDVASGHLTEPEPLSGLGPVPLVEPSPVVAAEADAPGLPVSAALVTVGAVLLAAAGAAIAGRRRLAPRHLTVRRRGRRLPTRKRRSAPS